MIKQKPKYLVSSAIVIFLVILDQIVKQIAAATLRGNPGYSWLGGVVRVEYVENSGAFLSLGADLSPQLRTLLFVVGVGFILAYCAYSLVKSANNWPSVIALTLVISGGIGNLIDRVSRGSVIDYVHMGIGSLRTGVFNVADVAISGGLLLMIWAQMRLEPEVEKRK